MSRNVFAMHDYSPTWHQFVLDAGREAWAIYTCAIGCDPNDHNGYEFREVGDNGVTPIARLNNGYGFTGTIPTPDRYRDFAQRCANFVAASPGCKRWVIANEIAMVWEFPQGEPITLGNYAYCFMLCRNAIKAVQPDAEVIPQAPAPWNDNLKYPGNMIGDWVMQLVDMLLLIGVGNLDGIALHTYTHGHDPALITSEATMNPPFTNRRFNFRAYQDFLQAIPLGFNTLPVYITEANPDGWQDLNNGWIQAAYQEINEWNQAGHQQVYCLAFYRWSTEDQDKYAISQKSAVIEDFKAALAQDYRWSTGIPVTPTFAPGQYATTCTAVRLRSEPSGEIIMTVPGEIDVQITGGPVAKAGLIWWHVFCEGHDGWMAQQTLDGIQLLRPAVVRTDFEKALAFVLRWEGGLSVDSSDNGNWTGGRAGVGQLKGTNFGISSLSYPDLDIAHLTKEQAGEIYERDYWKRAGCDQLPWPLSLAVFDFAVNAGVGQALQTLLISGHDFRTYNSLRRQFYQSLNQFPLYGQAWLRRVDNLEQYIT